MAELGLKPSELDAVRDILRRHAPGRSIVAFGSRVRGTAKPFSDLDLAVLGETPLAPEALRALNEAFSSSDLPIRVDVVDLASASPAFRKVVNDGPVAAVVG